MPDMSNGSSGKILTCFRTEKGIRDRNEDACGVFSLGSGEGSLYLLAVADGLGGHPAGEVASALAIRALHQAVSTGMNTLPDLKQSSLETILAAGFSKANWDVINHASGNPRCLGMGTTLVAALINQEGEGILGNVGDSRAYLFSKGPERITRDHSRVQEMVDAGILSPDEAVSHPMRHIVTRIIGRPGDLPDFYHFSMEDGTLVLCSDGLLDGMDDRELGTFARRLHIKGLCESLVEYARTRSRDNITVVAAARE